MTRPAVLGRYDELHDLVAMTVAAGPPDVAATALAASALATECRLLDTGRLAEWLGRWSDDGVMWVPLRPDAHPATDQSLFLDDRRRLGERVARWSDPAAWAQRPASTVVRLVGTVEAWPSTDGSLVVRSALVLTEHRGARVRTYAGHQVHRLVVTGEWVIAAKVLLLPALTAGTDNLAFLL